MIKGLQKATAPPHPALPRESRARATLYDDLSPSQRRLCTMCKNCYMDQTAQLRMEISRLRGQVDAYHKALNKMGRETGWAQKKIRNLLQGMKNDD